jgi:ubiquinone/menaquinone biosynthesis C-methylase UbiE
MTEIRRLHWGCGDITPAGWINADITRGPGIDISGDILDGLPLDDCSIDYITSQHALNEIKLLNQLDALRELRRVLKQGGVLRLCLPDLDRAIAAYHGGQQEYFTDWDWDTISGNFIAHILDYNYTYTPFTYEFATELLQKAGFTEIHRVSYRQTVSPYLDIFELDNRDNESFYVEAFK